MKQFFIFLSLAFATLTVANPNAFGQKLSNDDLSVGIEKQESIVETIFDEYAPCVHDYSDGKVYLNTKNLQVTSEGVFLVLKDSSLPLPLLFSDRNGPYVSVSDRSTYSITYCIGCGWPKFSGDRCKNPDCPLNK